MTESYSKAAKDQLLDSTEKKKKCCARMLSDILALTYMAEDSERAMRLSEAPSFGVPVIEHDTNSRGAYCYRELAKEIIKNNR